MPFLENTEWLNQSISASRKGKQLPFQGIQNSLLLHNWQPVSHPVEEQDKQHISWPDRLKWIQPITKWLNNWRPGSPTLGWLLNSMQWQDRPHEVGREPQTVTRQWIGKRLGH